MKRAWRIAAVAVFVLALVAGTLVGERVLALSEDTRQDLQIFTELLHAAHEGYGQEVAYRDMVYASIDGMLRTLDPHTSFLSPESYRNMREKQQSSFYGLGILVGIRNGQLTVVTPIEGTPAARLGIRAGDVIDTIEGDPTEDMTLDEAINRLKGPKDTQVGITILRRGLEEPLELTVTRAEIPQNTVRHAYMITPDTGYLWITDFARSTGGEVGEAIEALREQGMERLLLDLRNNGGGLLDQAIDVADYFVPDGAPIVETRGRTDDSFSQFADSGAHPAVDLPVVVLVNRGTASASEIVSGAIQDHDMGLIVGSPTWGKGLVQTVYNLPYGAGMALTTARYYTPTGRLIQRDYSSYFDYYYSPFAEGADEAPEPREGEPIFYTDLGREVYGGGGITPDLLVELDELPTFAQFLISRSSHFEFAVDYVRDHEIASTDWQPDEAVIEQFETWLVAEEVASAEEVAEAFADPENRADAALRIRAEVFGIRFGQDEAHRVRSSADRQIQEALAQFAEAEDLLAQRRALASEDLDQEAALRLEERRRADGSGG